MRARAHHAFALGILTLLAGCGDVASSDRPDSDPLETSRSAIIGGQPSTSNDDFVVFIGRKADKNDLGCGGTLVAPNLVLTAKHCVYEYPVGNSICDASGEPQIGSASGYVTGALPLENIKIWSGADGRKRFLNDEAPQAIAKLVVDDETPTLCSHDLAYVVLDRPLVGVPLGKLRLGTRPKAGPGALVSLAGWGMIEQRQRTQFRMRRAGIGIQRVGPSAPPPDATGSLGPRTFETGPGGCTGDSGSPAFDEETGTVLGVLARALNQDPKDPVSPCAADTVVNVYMTVLDFMKPLRSAFAAAQAEPWLEGREAPGYVPFGGTCASNLECAGNVCAGASEHGTGTCNVDCAKVGEACPSGYACDAGLCVQSVATELPSPTEVDGGVELPPPAEIAFRVGGGGCNSTSSDPSSSANMCGALALTACALVMSRIRMLRRSRH